MNSILELLPQPFPTIEILDLGAMALSTAASYQRLLDLGVARVIGFEPVAEECEKLNKSAQATRSYLPHFIGDGTEREFHLCNAPMTSSLYEPNQALCGQFQSLSELMQVTSRTPVKTTRLDDLEGLASIDYVKMDIQGAELDAVRGGARVLADAVVIESEVEFVPLYVNQPLFGDVDAALRSLGFLFHQFRGVAGRTLKPMIIGGDVNRALSQHLWADALWVPNLLTLARRPPEKLLKMAVVLHEVYRSFDFAMLALRHYDQQCGTTLTPAYLAALGA